MKVLVTASARFAITSDGNFWTPNASLGYYLWARYLEVFDEVHLMARAELHSEPPAGWNLVSGPGINAVSVPYFVGAWEFIKNYTKIRRKISKVVPNTEALLLRIPCSIGTEVLHLLPSGRPYGVEVVADSYDAFAPGSIRHPLRPLFRWWFPRELKHQCAGAGAAAYVTREALQRRYPCPNLSVGISDVNLSDQALISAPRSLCRETRPLTLIFVGTLVQLYKAPDVLLDAVAVCVREGLDIKLVLVGEGQYRTELEAQAAILGISERVCFLGQLVSSDAVRAELDRADLFLLPSHQEGLPKAMVEAMARALPCIGSTVGGIPELLPSEDLVPPGDVAVLASKIREVVTDPERMARMSARNLEKAKDYTDEVLREQRNEFYRYVREMTEAWLKQKN
ncbi:glycosyltransferase family 4 protein [Microcoleus sp. EPA2]|uniref:glycosyltransferase family 4 protein n=1 Tax=Microcoleus sp. EPA2 TaxID=2841654 RepID=UPI00312B2E2A